VEVSYRENFPTLSKGTVLAERYEIEESVGHGGYGRVYRAKDLKLQNKERAVKEIYPGEIVTGKLVLSRENFLKEASILCKLTHPGIPEVVDYFCNDRCHYIVMEYIKGITLYEKYRKENRLWTEKEVLLFALELCDVLDYLHSNSIIFRDLKPQNIIIDNNGKARLIDFGIARHFRPEQTKDTINIGTPGYAAPEQYGPGGGSDPRTDIYSLGVLLHYLSSGEDPQEKDETFKFLPLRELNSQITQELSGIIEKCLNLNKSGRFQNIRELRGALEDLHSGHLSLPAKKNSIPEKFEKDYSPSLPPGNSGIILERTGEEEFLIDIPGRGLGFTTAGKAVFLLFWIWVWLFGIITVFKHFSLSLNCFFLFWYAGGTLAIIFGLFNLLKILTSMFGKTSLFFEKEYLRVKTRWAGVVSTEKKFDMDGINNFGFEYNPNLRGLRALYDLPGKVYFHYNRKKITLPVSTGREENNWLCKEIERIFSFFS